jgi:hypothetical protein
MTSFAKGKFDLHLRSKGCNSPVADMQFFSPPPVFRGRLGGGFADVSFLEQTPSQPSPGVPVAGAGVHHNGVLHPDPNGPTRSGSERFCCASICKVRCGPTPSRCENSDAHPVTGLRLSRSSIGGGILQAGDQLLHQPVLQIRAGDGLGVGGKPQFKAWAGGGAGVDHDVATVALCDRKCRH